MIKAIDNVNFSSAAQTQNTKNFRKNFVSISGYAAVGFGTVCGVTGLKNVKFRNKMKIHKYSAYLAALSTFLHIAVIENFLKKKKIV